MNERNMNCIFESDGFDFILNSAKIITIAVEPFYCGDSSEALIILRNLSRHLQQKMDIDIETQFIEKFETYL